MKKFVIAIVLSLGVSQLASAATRPLPSHTVFQVGTAHGLQSEYVPLFTLNKIRNIGAVGLGAYEHSDGEMTVIDGEFYQSTKTGETKIAPPQTKTPIAVLARITNHETIYLTTPMNYDELKTQLDPYLKNKNLVYAFRIEGYFDHLNLKAANKNTSGKPLNDDEKFSHYEASNIQGTLIGFWSPDYLGTLNKTRFHFHFISEDKTLGGHVENMIMKNGKLHLQILNKMQVVIQDK